MTRTQRTITILAAAMSLRLAAETPRTKDGKPDISGVWQAERSPMSEFTRVLGPDIEKLQVDLNDVSKHFVNVFWGVKPEDEPLRPEGAAILKRRMQTPTERPMTRCLPVGVPAVTFVYAFKIVQGPDEIVMLPESTDPARQVYTDGRSLPKNPEPSWMGSSVGKWEGDTLVVETAGFKDTSWLDSLGHPRSESMHITERYRRRDFAHLDLEVTVEDSKYYTRPFKLTTGLTLIPNSDIFEYVCQENEKDVAHFGR